MSDWPGLDFEDRMPFGKYKDDTVAEVIDDDPKYMVWMLSEKPGMFTNDVEREILKYAK